MSEVIVGIRHNHITRDIKPIGECPGCDTRERLLKEIYKLQADNKTLESENFNLRIEVEKLESEIVVIDPQDL